MSLVAIPGGKQLESAAAASYARMCAAYGGDIPVTSAYRSYDEQVSIFLSRYTTIYAKSAKRDRRYWRGQYWWIKIGQISSAATPGESDHQLGLACDFGKAAFAWLSRSAAAFGWYRTIQSEAWHYVYFPSRDLRALDNHIPITIPEGNDMPTAAEVASAILNAGAYNRADGTPVPVWQAIGEAAQHSAESHRMLGALMGWDVPLAGPEPATLATLRGLVENASEARREGGVLLHAIAPAPGETP